MPVNTEIINVFHDDRYIYIEELVQPSSEEIESLTLLLINSHGDDVNDDKPDIFAIASPEN